MNQLFREFPIPLNTVSIGILYAKLDNERPGEVFDIKKLRLGNIKTNGRRIDQLISNHFPNLRSLRICDNFEKDEVIKLSKHHLSSLSLSKYSSELNARVCTKGGMLVFSTRKQLKKTRSTSKHLILPVSKDDTQDWPCITIICSSIEKQFICGQEACLKQERRKPQSLINWNLN